MSLQQICVEWTTGVRIEGSSDGMPQPSAGVLSYAGRYLNKYLQRNPCAEFTAKWRFVWTMGDANTMDLVISYTQPHSDNQRWSSSSPGTTLRFKRLHKTAC
jgi:hypothetical protein